MRAILIEEERFPEILDTIRLALLDSAMGGSFCDGYPEGMSESSRKILGESMFRTVNYHFVRWAQSHGASCVKR